MKRCSWLNLNNDLYVDYHDNEWAVPVYDDNRLFEALILEISQAGLSWETILNKRVNYCQAFDGFDSKKVAQYDDKKQRELLQNAGIVRHRLKIKATINNAQIFLQIQQEFGGFAQYLWQFVNHQPIIGHWQNSQEMPTKTIISDKISQDLKKRGMKFIGSTIIYAFMQAVGLVNDHEVGCFKGVT
jgi:DNA-3-methyladenine glycosylase I